MVQAYSIGTSKRGSLYFIILFLGNLNKGDTPGPGTYSYDKK